MERLCETLRDVGVRDEADRITRSVGVLHSEYLSNE